MRCLNTCPHTLRPHAGTHGLAWRTQVAVVQFSNDVRVEVGLAPLDSEALRKTTREMVRARQRRRDGWVMMPPARPSPGCSPHAPQVA